MILKGDERCEYCGLIANERDHVVPWIAGHATRYRRNFRDEDCVPACQECNRIASDKVFDTLEAKRDFIQEKIAWRYRKILKAPAWTEDEINELSGRLKKTVQATHSVRKLIEARLRWPYNEYAEGDCTDSFFDDLFSNRGPTDT